MFKVVLYLMLAVFLISLIRSVVGVLAKGFAELISPRPSRAQPRASDVPLTGELKRDPVCGTYTAAATSIKESFGNQTFYFCSPQCRDKYVASH
jgi:YHS domain-containing protein